MRMSDILQDLAYGELSSLSMSDPGTGAIKDSQTGRLTNFLNAGLSDLATRFVLVEKELMVRLSPARLLYPLVASAADNGPEPTSPKYITDDPDDPFTGGLRKILEIYDDMGQRLPMNDAGAGDNAVFTPSYDTLQVPRATEGAALFVIYQADHPKLDPLMNTPIEIPPALVPALRSYVAWRVFSPLSGKDQIGKAQEYQVQYETICQRVDLRDQASTSTSTTRNSLQEMGFI